MRDLIIMLTFVAFLTIGTMSPFVLALGYVWVDLFSPQTVTWSTLGTLPLSFIMGAASVAAYLVLDRRDAPRISPLMVMFGVMAIWISATTSWAAMPVQGEVKWEIAIKVMIFCMFIPFVVRSRIQIEAFAHVYVFSLAAHILPWAFKTILTGGGYGYSLGLVGANALWVSESSAVAAIGIMLLPLLLALRKHSLLLPKGRISDLIYLGTGFSGLFASIGTFARTAIVGLGVLGVTLFLRTKRKAAFTVTTLVVAAALFAVTSDKWTARISTIEDYDTESSSLIRLLVWKWTLGYVAENPFGGGFRVWMTNVITFPGPDPANPIIQNGRAFHSMYFAILGEHGIPGMVIYIALIAMLFSALRTVVKQTAGHPAHEWASDMAKALQVTIAVLLACGAFIDISFEPLVWYLFTMVICLREYVRRVLAPINIPASERFRNNAVMPVPAPAAGARRPMAARL